MVLGSVKVTTPDALTVLRELRERLDARYDTWREQANARDDSKIEHMLSGLMAAQDDIEDAIARLEREQAEAKPNTYSPQPCNKCGERKVTVDLEDESDGCGTYYEIHCEACGHSYKTDGPDA